MSTLSERARRILHVLKSEGPQTTKQLADNLALTPMGARQHLLQLQASGIVTHDMRSEKVGRPIQYWCLTDDAEQYFPDSHGQLLITMLGAVEREFGEEGLARLIQRRETDMLEQYLQYSDSGASLEAKLRMLSMLRNQEGYMAEFYQQGEDWWFIENHCPVGSAASRCHHLCGSELNLLQRYFGDEVAVSRSEHILAGQRRCAYRIAIR